MDSSTSTSTPSDSIIRRAAILLGACSLLFVLFGIVSAQTVQSQPVARLITGSNDEFARPRVGLSVSVAGSVESEVANTAGSIPLDQAFETERRAFNVTNDARVKNGLAALTWDAELCRMARMHSENMAKRKFFSHQTPEGLGLKERARTAGILHFKVLGENIAYNQGFDDPGAFAVERWLTSSQHRANILSQEFRASAVGTFVAADGRVYLTQVFILR